MARVHRAALLASALLSLISCAAAAEPQWLKLTSAHFELYTTAGEKDGRAALLRFEQVRGFFLSIGQTPLVSDDRVRLIGFDSRKEFAPYRPGENTVSFSFSEGGRDYIALERLDESTYPSAVFHYMQFLIRQSGLDLPLWLRRGVADVYSTLKPVAGQVQVGALMEGYRQTLEMNRMLDLETLTSASYDSPVYTDKEKSKVFYAQCWALAHMLLLSDQYAPKYPQFVHALASGASHAEAFQSVYGKPMARVQSELGGYLRGEWFKVVYFDTKLMKAIEPPQVQPATSVETGLVLVSLLREPEKKQAALQKLAQENPNSWEIAEVLGYAAWRGNNQDEARRRFADAARLGSTNARMYYDYSGLLRQAARRGAEGEEVIALLEKAVELQPEFPQARYNLGIYYYNARDYDKAAEHLAKAGTVERRDAPQYFRLLADSFHRIGRDEEALKAAQHAREFARTPDEMEEAEQLIAYVSGSPPPRRQEPAIALRESMGQISEEPAEEDSEQHAQEPQPRPAAPARETASAASGERSHLNRRLSDTPMESAGYTERQAGPQTESVSGTLLVLNCLGEPGAKLTIMAGRRQVPLLISDPTAVVITGVPGGKFDFVCGPQKPLSVTIDYEPTENKELGTLGVVRAIQFR